LHTLLNFNYIWFIIIAVELDCVHNWKKYFDPIIRDFNGINEFHSFEIYKDTDNIVKVKASKTASNPIFSEPIPVIMYAPPDQPEKIEPEYIDMKILEPYKGALYPEEIKYWESRNEVLKQAYSNLGDDFTTQILIQILLMQMYQKTKEDVLKN